jgi:tetratricopeptide (TPR) repeat protein
VGDEVHTIAIYLYGFSQQELGQLDEAEQCWREVLRIQEEENMSDKTAFTRANLGRLLIRRGRWREARAEAERGVEDVHGAGQTWIASYPFQTLGWLGLLQGEREAGIAYLQKALAMAKQIDDFQGIVNCQRSLAWLDIREGRLQGALDRLVPQRRRLEEQELPADTAIEAEVQLHLGDEQRAAEILGRLRVLATTGGARLTLVEVLRVSVMLAIRQERWGDAIRDLEEGLEIAREVGLPYDEGLLLYEYGRMHQAKRELEEAQARLTQALAIFPLLGAKPDVERTEQVLAEIGVAPSKIT